MSVSLANEQYSLPLAYRLYLPKEWAGDAARRKQAKVPETVASPQAGARVAAAATTATGRRVAEPVVVDAGYGVDTAFRQKLTALGFTYMVGITGAITVWPEGQAPLPPKPWSGRGLKPKRLRRDAEHQPLSAQAPAMQWPRRRFHAVTWREGNNQALSSRFAAVRVRCAHRDHLRVEPHPEQWLLIEWPTGEAAPTKYFLSTRPAATALKELVRVAKLRWRIERDYQELKQELGLGHFEGRSWRGFHHHATLCVATYAFLLAQRIAAPKKLCFIPYSAKYLPYPKASGPAAPLRRQRHVTDSITTLRLELAAALIAALERCPCCGRKAE